jgi:hypothetical protein
VVFSRDFTSTLVLGVMGELASFSGLKFRTALRMRLDVFGRVRMRTERQFKVASTSKASLSQLDDVLVPGRTQDIAHLLLSCSAPSILSRRPVASASNCLGSNKGWFGGIIFREMSRPLVWVPRVSYALPTFEPQCTNLLLHAI